MDAVLEAARQTGVCLEINANPTRLDLDEVYSRRAAAEGILLSINTDAHTQADLGLMEYGVSVARRAWVPPAGILNTWPPEEIRAWFKSRANRS
jgi:DNA polymerase (family 10)